MAVSDTRYRIRPREIARRFLQSPDDNPQLPTAKVPEKVAVPVPVPVPMPQAGSPNGVGDPSQRYKITPPTQDYFQPAQFPQNAPPNFFGTTPEMPAAPMGDTGTPSVNAPSAPPATPETPTIAPEPVPPGLVGLRDAQAKLSTEENAPVKKDKWWKSILKMLAYGAKDMPPAQDWGEFAYGAGRAGGAGIAGAVKHDLPGQIQKRYRIAQAEQGVERAQKTANIESTIQSRADMTKVRNARLKRDLTKDEALADQRNRTNVANDLKRLPYIDPTNPAHAKILARAKAAGIDVDPESFGKGKNRPRIQVLDDDGVTVHWFEKDPAKGWVPIRIEGRDSVSKMTDKRNPLTGQTYSSEQQQALAHQKFDFQKIEAGIHDRQRERALGLQQQGMDQKVASAQGEMDAIDEVLPNLESTLIEQSDPHKGDAGIAEQIQRSIIALKDRRGRAAGVVGGSKQAGSAGSFKYTEAEVRQRALAAHKDPEAAVNAARAAKLIP